MAGSRRCSSPTTARNRRNQPAVRLNRPDDASGYRGVHGAFRAGPTAWPSPPGPPGRHRSAVAPRQMAMNEFVDPGQRPADNPLRPPRRPLRPPRWPKPPPTYPALPYPVLPQPQPSGSPWLYADRPVQVRLVWSGWPVEIQGVRLRDVNTQTDSTVRPTGRLVADARRAFAQVLAEEIVATVWPAPVTGMSSPASSAELLNIAEESLDPRLLAAEVVRVTVQIAAVHAGIPPFVARLMGQVAGNLFTELSSPDPDAGQVRTVQYVDLALSAADGSLITSPALPQIVTAETANVIDELLGPDAPASPVREPASPARPSREPASPARPSREPASPARPSREPASPARPSREPASPASAPADAPSRHQPRPAASSDPVDSPRSHPSPTDIGGL
jgi:hypothetical protein